MSAILFRTARLDVRALGPDDVDDLLAVYGDPEAMAPLGDGEVLSGERCAAWVEVTARNVAERGYGMSALVERATGTVVGFAGLVHPGGQVEAELKYALRRDAWGRGLGTEAARGVLAWGATAFDLPRVVATVHPGNVASRRVLAKVGMREEDPRTEDDGSLTLVFAWDPTWDDRRAKPSLSLD